MVFTMERQEWLYLKESRGVRLEKMALKRVCIPVLLIKTLPLKIIYKGKTLFEVFIYLINY